MPALRYTPEELLHLRDSPLVQKPDELPNIEQWAETQPQNKNRTATTVRSDENENPRQRGLSQFETRGVRHAKKDGEEVFLGPKMSFASASAARQANKASYQDNDELRKFDRFAPREGRERTRDANGGETRFRNKLSVDEDEDRTGKFRNRPSSGRDEDPKRAGRGIGRGKFDQPWFRDATKDAILDESSEVKSAWRDEKPRRAGDKDWARRSKDEDPGWELSGASNEPAARTIDDFQKWKESMKAGDGATPRTEQPPTPQVEQVAEKPKAMQGSFFGNLGAVEDTPLESITPKPTNKKGKSRFQSFFGANDEPLPPEPPAEQPAASPKLAQTSTEDQAGFERMMAMLRMGGTNSQGPGPQLFSAPASQSAPKNGPPPGLPAFFDSNPASPPPQPSKTPASPMSQPNRASQTPASDRNSEFLLNLMKSQQPRTPFAEGQIYGQGYERKTPDTTASRYPPPQPPQTRGQASRFFSNEQPVANSNAPIPQSPPQDNNASRFIKEQRPPPGFDQPPLPQQIYGGRPPSPPRMQPPPGFPARPPPPSSQHIPPGFYNAQFPPHMGGPGAGPMRGPMPQQPPGFFNPPPGFSNVPPGMHGPGPGQRRSGGIPPGFDVFAGAPGPGAPPGPNGRPMMGPGGPPPVAQGMPPSQGGYAQYAQQMGAGAYKGM